MENTNIKSDQDPVIKAPASLLPVNSPAADAQRLELLRSDTVLIIYNPVSGMWQNKNNLFDLIESVSASGKAAIVRMTQAHGDATAIARRYAPYVSSVIACGGDGTLQEAIQGLHESGCHIPIGYIPIGTTNDFAATHSIPFDFHAAAMTALHGTPRALDIGQINGDRIFSYIACFGVFTKTPYTTDQAMKNMFGYLAYILQGASELADIGNPTHMTVVTEAFTMSDDFIFGGVVNSYTVAHFFKLPESSVDLADGEFEVLLVRQPQNLFEAHMIAQALLNCDYTNKNIEFFHASDIRFISEEPVKWCSDGEYSGEFREVTINNLHHAIQLQMEEN
ncbi:MAG: diacylglycerol/lipid kinase family protein [Eubacteriaceae bacterium]|jgi:diacylglycerol kinase (ATP)